ncbi:hypothetical protein KA075_02805 [Candidatus Saccharibacteria bacterium]|jgi:hypothetical protein|nr:hypothetical protein [Candidatus Saccharibacteria bacterium]
MANFDQAPLVSFEQSAESLNRGMSAVSKMSQLDFFGKAALATSQASKKLGIESRELTAGKSRLEYFIKTLRPGGSDNPQLRLDWAPDSHAHVDHVLSVSIGRERVIKDPVTIGMALKAPENSAQLIGPFPAVFPNEGDEDQRFLLANYGSNLGPDPMETTVGVVNELYALMEDLRAA